MRSSSEIGKVTSGRVSDPPRPRFLKGTLRYPGRGRGGRQPEVKCSILGTN